MSKKAQRITLSKAQLAQRIATGSEDGGGSDRDDDGGDGSAAFFAPEEATAESQAAARQGAALAKQQKRVKAMSEQDAVAKISGRRTIDVPPGGGKHKMAAASRDGPDNATTLVGTSLQLATVGVSAGARVRLNGPVTVAAPKTVAAAATAAAVGEGDDDAGDLFAPVPFDEEISVSSAGSRLNQRKILPAAASGAAVVAKAVAPPPPLPPVVSIQGASTVPSSVKRNAAAAAATVTAPAVNPWEPVPAGATSLSATGPKRRKTDGGDGVPTTLDVTASLVVGQTHHTAHGAIDITGGEGGEEDAGGETTQARLVREAFVTANEDEDEGLEKEKEALVDERLPAVESTLPGSKTCTNGGCSSSSSSSSFFFFFLPFTIFFLCLRHNYGMMEFHYLFFSFHDLVVERMQHVFTMFFDGRVGLLGRYGCKNTQVCREEASRRYCQTRTNQTKGIVIAI